ncbi:MAG: WecB/TagA/CpsF family glycosyltransferase [Balneolaceae bacterium]
MNVKKVSVLGVPMYDGCIESYIEQVLLEHSHWKNLKTSATGAHGLIESRGDNEFYEILKEFEFNLPDGKPAVWVARAKGAKDIQRCFGPYVFSELMKASSSSDLKHYLCGGKEGVAVALKTACEQKFDNQNIVGTHCPPFRALSGQEFESLADEINKSKADVVWVGISTPKQEKFAYKLSKYTNVKCLITVGAAFDYHTGSITPAPHWMQEGGLEWLFRLYMEPGRLWRRYINIVPKFLIFGIMDIFGLYNHPLKKNS